MSDFDNEFEIEDQPDQTVTYGGYIPPLPPDHWSLRSEWRKYKEGLSEAVSPRATEELPDWKGFASALSGHAEETEL